MSDNGITAEPAFEGVRRLPSGAVAFMLEGREVRMRPPKTGTIRELAEAEEDIRLAVMEQGSEVDRKLRADDDKLQALERRRVAKRKKLNRPDSVPEAIWKMSEAKADEERLKLARRINAGTRGLREWERGQRFAWFRRAYVASTNGDAPPLPADDDAMEAWMANPLLARAVVLNHWESLPLSPFSADQT